MFQMECYLWAPHNKKYRYGQLYIGNNFVCFRSHVPGLVSVVIPLKEVNSVEKENSPPRGNTVDDAIVFVMRNKPRENGFFFAQITDRDFMLEKLSELLSKLQARMNKS